ncbi:MAG: VOC family protein [bacterium]|nr:VOC family protein [bacterium]
MVELQRPVLDIGLVVRDIEKSLAFYRDTLGMKPTRQINLDTESARAGGVSKEGFDIQYMQFGDVNLKLISFPGAPPATSAGIDGASGYRYVTMWVKDIMATYKEWKSKGAEFLSEPIRRTPEIQMVFLRDPDGNLIEVLGP